MSLLLIQLPVTPGEEDGQPGVLPDLILPLLQIERGFFTPDPQRIQGLQPLKMGSGQRMRKRPYGKE